MYGTRCFGCSGRGWVHTKRGAAASRFFSDSLCVPASDVQVGQMIRVPGLAGIAATRWLRVTAIEADEHKSKALDAEEWTITPAVRLIGVSRKAGVKSWDDPAMLEDYGYGVSATTLVRVEHTGEAKAAKIAAALAYQATLTQAGTPRKR